MSRVRNEFWRSIVKEVEQTVTYPGYRYVYYTSFDEFDTHMQSLGFCDWRTSEWFRVISNNSAEESKDLPVFDLDEIEQTHAVYTANKNDYEYVARYYIQRGITDAETLKVVLERFPVKYADMLGTIEYNYKPTITTLSKYIRKYSNTKKRASTVTPTYIIQGLVKFYQGRNMSLRQIARKLAENDGINMSHEAIRAYIT